jgi:murein L,D-transpeptidase YafK
MAPDDRVKNAQATRRAVVEKLFGDAGVAFPPAELLFRAFKKERELEVWAASQKGGAMTRISTYEICTISGDVGPKRREGDMQVPEGFYTIQYYWPVSNYHLEMKVGYPNASDRVFGGKAPGGDIMIHGNCASIGCIAMGDERVEELWVMGTAIHSTTNRVHVHIFPARDMTPLLSANNYATHRAFWMNIKEGLDLFEQSRRLPTIAVDWRGRYSFQ